MLYGENLTQLCDILSAAVRVSDPGSRVVAE